MTFTSFWETQTRGGAENWTTFYRLITAGVLCSYKTVAPLQNKTNNGSSRSVSFNRRFPLAFGTTLHFYNWRFISDVFLHIFREFTDMKQKSWSSVDDRSGRRSFRNGGSYWREVLWVGWFLYAFVAGLDVDTVNYHITSLPLALHYQCTGAKCRYK